MKVCDLRKYHNKQARVHFRAGVGDYVEGFIYTFNSSSGSAGYAVVETLWGNINIDVRAIESVTVLKAKKLMRGE